MPSCLFQMPYKLIHEIRMDNWIILKSPGIVGNPFTNQFSVHFFKRITHSIFIKINFKQNLIGSLFQQTIPLILNSQFRLQFLQTGHILDQSRQNIHIGRAKLADFARFYKP